MANIIYAKRIESLEEDVLKLDMLDTYFQDALEILDGIDKDGHKIGYFFIDPLIDHYEAANRFYFEGLKLDILDRISLYRTGASPIQALSDAKLYIENGIYDAIAIFTFEPLYSDKKRLGSAKINEAMDIFQGLNLISSYDKLAKEMCKQLSISEDEFIDISDKLYENYAKTFTKLHPDRRLPDDRGQFLEKAGSDLFKLTDVANPNIDFTGGLIVANKKVSDKYNYFNSKYELAGAASKMVKANPASPQILVGRADNIFPHLNAVAKNVEAQAKIVIKEELNKENLFLAAYTCYPTSPLGFLFATNIIDSVNDIDRILEKNELTVEGGMSLGRAPWNNPALSNTILLLEKMEVNNREYGLVQGNGGLGESQGLAIIKKIN